MNTKQAIMIARERLKINSYPGNLFEHIVNDEMIMKTNNLFLFKEDLDKLSGFISYENGNTFIGINYKRPIGHQNFTLAHEIGHWIMDFGKSFDDVKCDSYDKKKAEKNASNFANELLYPEEIFNEDYREFLEKRFLENDSYYDLAYFIDEICKKHFLSFECVFYRFLFKYESSIKNYKCYLKKIKNQLGFNYSFLDKNFYIAKNSTYSKRYLEPYKKLEKNIKIAIDKGNISIPTGEAILFSQGIEKEFE